MRNSPPHAAPSSPRLIAGGFAPQTQNCEHYEHQTLHSARGGAGSCTVHMSAAGGSWVTSGRRPRRARGGVGGGRPTCLTARLVSHFYYHFFLESLPLFAVFTRVQVIRFMRFRYLNEDYDLVMQLLVTELDQSGIIATSLVWDLDLLLVCLFCGLQTNSLSFLKCAFNFFFIYLSTVMTQMSTLSQELCTFLPHRPKQKCYVFRVHVCPLQLLNLQTDFDEIYFNRVFVTLLK